MPSSDDQIGRPICPECGSRFVYRDVMIQAREEPITVDFSSGDAGEVEVVDRQAYRPYEDDNPDPCDGKNWGCEDCGAEFRTPDPDPSE